MKLVIAIMFDGREAFPTRQLEELEAIGVGTTRAPLRSEAAHAARQPIFLERNDAAYGKDDSREQFERHLVSTRHEPVVWARRNAAFSRTLDERPRLAPPRGRG